MNTIFASSFHFTTEASIDPLIHFVLLVSSTPLKCFLSPSQQSLPSRRPPIQPKRTHLPYRFQTTGFPGQRLTAYWPDSIKRKSPDHIPDSSSQLVC
jgi:hypothetical protein